MLEPQMFFDGWQSILRVIAIGVCAYVAIVIMLRGVGHRALSKMNVFDFVVTIALGSTLATILLSRDTALAEGIAAFATLVLLQLLVTFASSRWNGFRRLIHGPPRLLYYRGAHVKQELLRSRVTEQEVAQAVRQHGYSDMDEVQAVVLESDGRFAVIGGDGAGDEELLANARVWDGK